MMYDNLYFFYSTKGILINYLIYRNNKYLIYNIKFLKRYAA